MLAANRYYALGLAGEELSEEESRVRSDDVIRQGDSPNSECSSLPGCVSVLSPVLAEQLKSPRDSWLSPWIAWRGEQSMRMRWLKVRYYVGL
jgi:hypothetical protein